MGYDYGRQNPVEGVKGEKIVFMDVTLPINDLVELSKENEVMVIDHHKSFFDECKKYEEENGTLPFLVFGEIGKAACELVWQFYYDNHIPMAVKLLGVYDTWRKKNEYGLDWETEIMPFQHRMRSITNRIDTYPSDILSNENERWRQILAEGAAILEYKKSQDEWAMNRYAFEAYLDGVKCICINSPSVSSDAFNSVYDKTKHDLMVQFSFNGGAWDYTLFSEKVDVSIIAKKFGGGGHQGAAGFSSHFYELKKNE
jgi:uncharacterized protein